MAKHQNPRAKPWDDATIAQIRAWVADGWHQAKMADALKITRTGFHNRCLRLGIPIPENQKAQSMARGLAVLRQHYGTNPDGDEVLRLYREAVGENVSRKVMGEHANRHGIMRDNSFRAIRIASLNAVRYEQMNRVRAEKARAVQELLNQGVSLTEAATRLGHGDKIVRRMRIEGLITLPPRVRKKPEPKPRKPREPKPKPAPRPKPAPVTYVAPLPPPPPPPLPPPAENGKIYAPFAAICGWADQRGIYYDGRQIDKLNAIRAAAGLAPLVQDEGASA